jgi:hypothetical protein
VELGTYDDQPPFGPYVVLDGLQYQHSDAMVLARAIIDGRCARVRPG